jgi:hypothetical protein
MSRRYRAWVVRWEWVGPHAAVEKPFVTIAPIRWRETRVGELVEHLYAILSYDQGEIVEALRGGGHNPYRSRWGTVTIDFGSITQTVPSDYEVSCGHNPFLVARRAYVWPVGDGSGRVSWLDDAPPQLSEPASTAAN